jgi:hypothetical protein
MPVSRYIDAQLLPVAFAIGDRLGLTVWAPKWHDRDGEEVQGFLGTGRQLFAFANADELAQHLADHPQGDLSDHPAWPSLLRRQPAELRAAPGDLVDFDEVFTLLTADPSPQACEEVSKAVQLAEAMALCCQDEELLGVLDREPYQLALGDSAQFAGPGGYRDWQRLGAEAATSWEWIVGRLERHISWVGDMRGIDLAAVQQPSLGNTPWLAHQQAVPSGWNATAAGLGVTQAQLPSRMPTVLVTLFFGLFGLIPAAVATSQARTTGINTGRYWAAFGWTLLASFLLWLLLVALLASAVANSA